MGIIALSLLVLGCGGGGDDDDGGGGGGNNATGSPAAGAAQTLTIKAGDWYFEPNNLTVKAGSPVTVTFQSTGPMFPHTFNIKNLNGEGELFSSERFENGTTGTFTFTVSQPGSYQILCLIRGHADRGQTGTLTVTAQ
jgi:plastocyanin